MGLRLIALFLLTLVMRSQDIPLGQQWLVFAILCCWLELGRISDILRKGKVQ